MSPGRFGFLCHYIWKQGFRDGYRGWVLCRLLAWYEWSDWVERT